MIRTLDRYLLKSFLINYVLSTAVLISLYVVLDLFVNLDEFTKAGDSLGKVLIDITDYYFYNLPMYFSQIAGVITLFAACGTLARMQRQNEVIAVLASGTSLYRLVVPIVLGGLGMNLLVILDHEVILPAVASKLARQRDDVEGVKAYEIWFVRDGEGRLISAQQFSPKEGRVRELIIMELSTEPETYGQMQGMVTAFKAEWDDEGHGWELIDGRRIAVPGGAGDLFGAEQSIDAEIVHFYPSELPPEELMLRMMGQWTRFLSYGDLRRLEERGDVNPEQIAKVIHERFTMPINNMILLLLGMSFFMTRAPANVLNQGAKAMAVSSVCFLVAFMGQQVVDAAGIDPALPAWLPVFLFGPVAVLLLDNVKT